MPAALDMLRTLQWVAFHGFFMQGYPLDLLGRQRLDARRAGCV
jgi:hypothetical protein